MQDASVASSQNGSQVKFTANSQQQGHIAAERKYWIFDDVHERICRPTTNAEKIDIYDQVADQYEALADRMDFYAPSVVVERLWPFLMHQASTASTPLRVLDAGCGTGLCSLTFKQLIAAVGKQAPKLHTIGADWSKEMMALAREKDFYDELVTADINKPLPIEPVEFILASGLFCEGNCGSHALQTLLGILQKGGYACLSIRKTLFDAENEEYMKAIEKGGCELVECELRPYARNREELFWMLRKA